MFPCTLCLSRPSPATYTPSCTSLSLAMFAPLCAPLCILPHPMVTTPSTVMLILDFCSHTSLSSPPLRAAVTYLPAPISSGFPSDLWLLETSRKLWGAACLMTHNPPLTIATGIPWTATTKQCDYVTLQISDCLAIDILVLSAAITWGLPVYMQKHVWCNG